MTRIKALTISEIVTSTPTENKSFLTKSGIAFRRVLTLGVVEEIKPQEKYASAVVSEGDFVLRIIGWEDNRDLVETLNPSSLVLVDGVLKQSKPKSEKDGQEKINLFISSINFIKEINDQSFVSFWYAKLLSTRQKADLPFPLAPFSAIIEKYKIPVKETKNGYVKIDAVKPKTVRRITRKPATKKDMAIKVNGAADAKKEKKKIKVGKDATIENHLKKLQTDGTESFSYDDLLSWGAKNGFTDSNIEAEITRLLELDSIRESDDDRNTYELNF